MINDQLADFSREVEALCEMSIEKEVSPLRRFKLKIARHLLAKQTRAIKEGRLQRAAFWSRIAACVIHRA